MANATTGSPWTLDTADVIKTTPGYIHRIIWTPVSDGDDILIQDNGGNNVWKLKAIAGDTNQAIEYERVIEQSVNGFNLVTLDSGTVYVYVR